MSLNGTGHLPRQGDCWSEGIAASRRGARHGACLPGEERTYVDIGPVESIPPGQGRSFILAGRTVAVFRQRDGHVFATDDECPHRGGPLADGILGDGKVICPMHGWKIELTSGKCLGESSRVSVYDVVIVSGRIFLGWETPKVERAL